MRKNIQKVIIIALAAIGISVLFANVPGAREDYGGAGEIWWTTVPQVEEAFQRLHKE